MMVKRNTTSTSCPTISSLRKNNTGGPSSIIHRWIKTEIIIDLKYIHKDDEVIRRGNDNNNRIRITRY